jgi:hypothetical protein
MISTLLVVNLIISVLHSVKHIPQCIYMIKNRNADGLSLRYIQGELLLNMLSVGVTFKLFLILHNAIYLLPILLEKSVSFGMIIVMFCLKCEYSNNEIQIMDDVCDDWRSVESHELEEDDWRSVDSE